MADKSIGIGNKENLASWADYAKGNSNLGDKSIRDAKADPGLNDDWKQPQKREEGRGWVKPSATTADNTYTGPGGSKQD